MPTTTQRCWLLRVTVEAGTPMLRANLRRRFGEWHDGSRVEVLVSSDEEAMRVYDDEFRYTEYTVDNAIILELPYPAAEYVPFTGSPTGETVLYELAP